ncbi:MAG: M15 family metallopeptidase, partial [Pseudobdellovibrionaceae bacterium]|nr:M15 family metallopeptidase [Pseudobdellovibrionaceae bacterium]
DKVTDKLTARFEEKDTLKIAGSGHYIFKGRPQALYQEIVRDVGSDIVLTSGIRSVVKQLHLFLTKAINCEGNLSRASRSLAPPGHSYHGISDFDVGKLGWGYRNFTDHFAKSDVFKRLIDLGYVDIRYTPNNSYGVRFEPWHIKVG